MREISDEPEVSPGSFPRTQVLDEGASEYVMRQFLFASQARVLLKLRRVTEVRESTCNVIVRGSQCKPCNCCLHYIMLVQMSLQR